MAKNKMIARLLALANSNEEESFTPEFAPVAHDATPAAEPVQEVTPVVSAAAEIVVATHSAKKKRGKKEVFSPAVGEAIRHLASARFSYADAAKWLAENGVDKAEMQNVRNYAKRHNIEFPGKFKRHSEVAA